ncbi:hypothetical protein GGR56DRAFT_357991 [Xylariaceae sp. FL0804]|nr:hypothetical protein GGR56DRAFT_357991 [Xylariaceae sp. FL0804]
MDMQFCAQPTYASAFGFVQPHGNPMQYAEGQYPVHPGFPGLQYMYGFEQPGTHLVADRGILSDGKTDSKPRLSKEEVERLEKVFQENPKPSSSVKAQLADALGLERPRINNWFQNRRAKAKQERKQEEYEARRAAEKANSEPVSPEEDVFGGTTEHADETPQKRMQPSSAVFPDLTTASHAADAAASEDDEDEDGSSVSSHDVEASPTRPEPCQAEVTEGFHSPASLDFSHTAIAGLAHDNMHHDFSQHHMMPDYDTYLGQAAETEQRDHAGCPRGFSEGLPSPSITGDCAGAPQYSNMMGSALFSSTNHMFFRPQASDLNTTETAEELLEAAVSSPNGSEMAMHTESLGMPTPTDSFKSPPPPANIASRRKIPRPAALQATSLRSRSYHLGCGPKTAMDGSKSPVVSMRRIASATGSGPGRIQKASTGPRSPMYIGRTCEAVLQYRARSPAGSVTASLTGAAPPTPMTPAVLDHQTFREPTVSSACSDDGSFMIGAGHPNHMMQEFKVETNLKTPPSTPGLMASFATNGCSNSSFASGMDFSGDQPLLTPFFQTEFPDLTLRHTPSYVDLNDEFTPTRLYPNLMESYTDNPLVNIQYDWDANEAVVSPKASPSQARSKQIQFTPNMTPQDYTAHRER